MRLSPAMVAAVAIAAPLSTPISANAQTANPDLSQPAEVLTSATNQQSENGIAQEESSEQVKSAATFPEAATVKASQAQTVAALPIPAANKTQPVIVPTAMSTTGYAYAPTTPSAGVKALQGLQSRNIAAVTIQPTNPALKSVIVPSATPNTSSAGVRALQGLQSRNIAVSPMQTAQTPQETTPQPTPQETTPQPTLQQAPQTTPQETTPQPTLQQAPQTTPRPTTPQQTTPQPTPGTQQPAPAPAPGATPPLGSPVFPTNPDTSTESSEPRVLVSEVAVRAQSGQLTPELENQVYSVVRTQPGRTTTRTQLQEDINAIFGTGFFSNVQAVPEDTPLGVRVSFVVQPNPILTKVQVQANPGTSVPSVLPQNTADEVFREQYGKILNLRDLQEGIKQLTKRYQDKGYVLANVIGAPQVSESGVVTLQIAEGVVENIRVRFRNKEGQETDEQGQPIRGRTQPYIVTRELELKPGQVFNRNTVQRDLQRVYGLGIFEDVNVSLDPGSDPSRVDVVVNVAERNSGSIAAGAGISSASGLFGTISYQQQNLNGRNQKLGAELQVGERELLFDLRFTDPWIDGDPYRTSYTANIFRRRSISLIFDGKDQNIETFLPGDTEGDRPRVVRLGGGVTFTRPLSANPFGNSEWTASAGFQYQRVSTKDADGNSVTQGTIYQNGQPTELIPLTQSGSGDDDLFLLQVGAQRDLRNNPLQPTSGSYLRFGVDQSVPIGQGSIFLTRLRGSYSQYLPISLLNFSKGPQTLAFNLQGGTVLGDLPPYEAFTLGGSNSVRGYEEGTLTSARSYVQASVEYRFPVFSVVSGALFFDFGTDLGTSTRAAEILNKNGTGYGYGLGVRVQSPLGPIRVDYGINDDGDSRINFGIGERF
ncbi:MULTISPECIES: BamA/TamA family outer membrane protein [unclassified Tolypothrix]|uniref:BamA/TamA family outer membrane protein n=1 Tax=unclassified Tolypothrix TaxID=2649714 RepID=UPI0005F7AF56|nr:MULTISPECIES: BamA/TamA family outer membrane protein [unclassified Tolypothrix]MBE9084834.1 BamA/TamA family outer membrane protein [Tolypothrix sp. LEGE 11397]UYD24758.1 BamA/TamA family outer membrane protein [Tolypothrix sp. PCC 7712]UYD33011.1 BamA/TamA family outer membrane protein [Tolypothrix sp. PCC 7601]BAY90605.1 surface antigen D15 domain-containing protein [Microchaete diplosiphon NIES-3275]